MDNFFKSSIKDKLLYLIIILLGFQQFPVVRVGGSFKVYELIAVILLLISTFKLSDTGKIPKITFIALLFFIVSPVISFIYSNFFLPYPSGFFSHYADTSTSFKYNYYIFPVLQLFLMCLCVFIFSNIIAAESLYFNFDKLLKSCIFFGTIICFYSFIALNGFDFVASLPNFIQNKFPQVRATGLSQEPGTYVLYQTWITLFVIYSKHLYSKKKWLFLLIINGGALLLTTSTTLVILLFMFIFTPLYIKKMKFSLKRFFLALFAIGIAFLYVVYSDLLETLQYTFFVKINTFVIATNNTNDSGGMRHYTSSIGYDIFLHNLIFGVGVGRSQYYMYQYEFKEGITYFYERLWAGSSPQNLYATVLSEQGVIGAIFFILLIIKIFSVFWANRNKSKYHKMFLIGSTFNIFAMLAIYPAYHLFLWMYMALGLGYVRYFNKYKPEKVL